MNNQHRTFNVQRLIKDFFNYAFFFRQRGDQPMQCRFSLVPWIVLSVVLAGCVTSPPARFYTLSSLPDLQLAAKTGADAGQVTIGIGPIEVPAYLDRPQIVTRIGSNELRMAEFDHWAEPLSDTLLRVLLENLSVLLEPAVVTVIPWKGHTTADYQIALEVIRFDGNTGDAAVLVARWYIFDGDDQHSILTRKTSIQTETKGADIRSLVAAQSQALAGLSSRIATDIRRVID
jgi:uncharacterized lipoprotein YmbA